MTKEMKQKWQQYYDSETYDLDQCYKTYSDAKAEAWENCKQLCREYNGCCLKVITHSIFTFTAGFIFSNDDNETCFYLITPSHEKIALVKDLISVKENNDE